LARSSGVILPCSCRNVSGSTAIAELATLIAAR
jgi:hypothetical protein